MLKNSGMGMDEVADKTIDLTKRAADMASVFNTDVSDALTAIQAALRGEADPIERYGVKVSAAAVQQKALADTGKQAASALTDQELAAARLALIFEQTDAVAGDFANTSDGLANKTRIANARMEEMQATIGEKLLPVSLLLTEAKLKLATVLSETVLPALESFVKYIRFAWEEGDTLNDFLADLPTPLQGAAKVFGEMAVVIKEDVLPALQDVARFLKEDWWPAFKTGLDTVAPLVEKFFDYILTHKEALIAAIAAVGVAIFLALGPLSAAAAALIGIITLIGTVKANWQELKEIVEKGISVGGIPIIPGHSTGPGSGQSADNFFGIPGLPNPFSHRAGGGPVSGGRGYIVGENGPEIFVPGSSGAIIPNGGGGAVINVTVNGSVITERELTRVIRDAIGAGGFRGVFAT